MNNNLRTIGGAIGTALVAAAFAGTGDASDSASETTGFGVAFLLIAGPAACGVVSALGQPKDEAVVNAA